MTSLEVVPLEHIQHLIVELRGEVTDHRCKPSTRNGVTHTDYRPADVLCNSLEPLLSIKNPVGFRLELVISANAPKRVEEILAALKRFRRQLMAAGMEVRVTCGTTFYLHQEYPSSLDLYFDQSKKEWLATVAEHRGPW